MNTHSKGGGQVERADIEDFLYLEADLLDNWLLDDWLKLFTEDAVYEIPATDNPDGRPEETLYIVADNREVLEGRVKRLQSVDAFVESPRSNTRRMISNVRVVGCDDDCVEIVANFMVVRMRKGTIDTYIGRYERVLEVGERGNFLFRRRRAVLDHDALRPHGKISIIL